MKNISELFSKDLLHCLYLSDGIRTIPVLKEQHRLSPENFGIICILNDTVVILTLDDFSWAHEDGTDRKICISNCDTLNFINNTNLPDEVIAFLNIHIGVKFATVRVEKLKTLLSSLENETQLLLKEFIANFEETTVLKNKLEFAKVIFYKASDAFEFYDKKISWAFGGYADILHTLINETNFKILM